MSSWGRVVFADGWTLTCRHYTDEERAERYAQFIAEAHRIVGRLRFPHAGESYPDPEMDALVRRLAELEVT